jgi:hypothetical protein
MVIELSLAGVTGDPAGLSMTKEGSANIILVRFVLCGGTLRMFVQKVEAIVSRVVVCDGSDAVASMQMTTTRRCLRSIVGVPR